MLLHVTATGVSRPFAVNGLIFGVSIGAMGVIILVISAVLITVIATFIRQSKRNDQAIISTTEHHTPNTINKQSSSHNISTERNIAYELTQFHQ